MATVPTIAFAICEIIIRASQRYPKLTHARLRQILNYDPETGVFNWKINNNVVHVGMRAGHINIYGYRVIAIDRAPPRKASRLAWFYMTGRWPKGLIDHINRNCSDDRFCNIPEPLEQNGHNRVFTKNKTGVQNVSFRHGRYRVISRVGGIERCIGNFSTLTEAKVARDKAADKLYGKFNPVTRSPNAGPF